jgi:uncharacterized protein YecT (DUF1311 family)
MRCLIVVAVAAQALLAGRTPAAAKDEMPNVDCAKAQSTYEMNFCAENEFKKADAALNAAYKTALTDVAASGDDNRKSWEEALRTSQRAWVAFRDADCRGLVPMEWQGGTGATAAELECMTQLTIARTKDLRDRYGNK